ncbi:Phosphoinositide 3-phosphatase [Saitozyma sp. JCM 24511]|nr:Phosphoinositide 3-phosphatase [Saitozyma sp. JCM 24511]
MDAIRVAKVDNVVLERPIPPSTKDGVPTRSRQTGTLHLTPHHLIFDTASTSSETASEIWIPYPTITLLTRLPQSIAGLYPLQIRTRTFGSYVLLFDKDRQGGAEDVWQSVKDCAVARAASVEQLYAFFYTLSPPLASQIVARPAAPLSISPDQPQPVSNASPVSSGWSTFNPRAEFARQGVGSRTKAWRFTDINKDYAFCPTYPTKLVVPSRISDSTLAYAGKYRSKARIPALTYLHWANHASITRSSQPMVGLKNSRSAQDERLVECIFSSHQSPDTAYATASPSPSPSPSVYGATSTNLIIDARPTANAMANVAVGAGTENMDNYKTGKKAYLGIDNIHVMRNSLKVIAEAITEAESSASGTLDRGLLRKSNWLKHISTLLDGALVIVKNIHLNASHVLIHCSDGWDRTSQLSAMAQICLDPYYRTFDGFKVLVEKDWLAFGHKFLDRSGHLSSEKLFTVTDTPDDDTDDEGGGAQKAAQALFAWGQKQFASSHHLKEVSPVFHQFLECVWQVQRQFPERFEFNEEYLLDLYHHLYACQFGTFLFNCERDRRVPDGGKAYVERTVSAWDWFDRVEQRTRHVNSSFDPTLDDRSSRSPDADQGVLMFDPRDVKFWYRLFRRGDEEMNGGKIAAFQASGADLLTVGPGQVDPVSVDGAIDHVTSEVNGGEGFANGIPATGAAGSGGGWNWSQLSTSASSALGALQGAAREIKSIGQEAIGQIRAEAADGESWARSARDAPGTRIGEGRPSTRGNESTSARSGLRMPSEANPWSVDASTARVPASVPLGLADPGPRPQTKREPSWTANPWGESAMTSSATASLADLTLRSDNPSRAATEQGGPGGDRGEQTSSKSDNRIVSTAEDKRVEEAALGGDRKAWDPLGAL